MDIGTESVGMACTDENYNLLRAKGKDLWAVRLFDEANDASARRTKRTARRRLQRRKRRIEWLQDVFAPFMEDKLFFLRLNNSGFFEEDKDEKLQSKFSLFSDADYTDREFHERYPTVFHLRFALANGANEDLRHYYLALHHIIKYRGHFLFEGEGMGAVRDAKELIFKYNESVKEGTGGLDLTLDFEKEDSLRQLMIASVGVSEKKRRAMELLGAKTKEQKELIALLVGGKGKVSVLFGDEYLEKYQEIKSISFAEIDDDTFGGLSSSLEDEHFAILENLREIYSYYRLEKVRGGKKYISDAMVALYEKHKEDLRLLKRFVKDNYSHDVYYKIFRSQKEKANYANYIGYTRIKNEKQAVGKCSAEEFFKFLKKIVSETPANDEATRNAILEELQNETFLPKILNADGGLFPHQVNGAELNDILDHLCNAYPTFAEKDEDGYTPKEKIQKIFTHKIPYYVGPLQGGWMQRKEGKDEKITPWNFDEVVDFAKSNEQFMRRMTNKCSYYRGKDVLPKGSMYYQAYNVLNQINRYTVNGELSVELKQELFNNVFLKNKKVTKKTVITYLKTSGKVSPSENVTLGGRDGEIEITASMSSYCLFKGKFGDLVDKRPDIFENIILWHTLNTDKRLVEGLIRDHYHDVPQIIDNLAWLKGLTAFKEFGRLSKEFLCELPSAPNPATGEVYSILNRLYHTNENLNQLLYDERYTFIRSLEEVNAGGSTEVTYEDVEELYVSPMVRRGIWQALQMADEYVKAVGRVPNKIFVEVTRADGKKGNEGRTQSRKAKLLQLYKGVGADCENLDELVSQLNREETTDSRLRQERLYLYYLQLGKCAYTGERIDLGQLGSDLYDVDHIVPQSMTKDDSLDNKVLVKREKNAQKTNTYPLPAGFSNQKAFWKILRAKGLMSEEKYSRLTRTTPLTEDDFREFINRQMVVTNQTVKAAAELLKRKYEPFRTKVVFSKAKNVDSFKQKFDIVKCRDTNDLHHARDAYLNVVVGNIFDTKFSSTGAYFYSDKEGVQRGYNLEKIFFWKIDGAWKGKEDAVRIKQTVQKTSMQVTRYAFVNKGGFYNETIYKGGDNGIAAPRKNCAPYIQTEKYGGYKSLTTAYFAIVQSKGKKGEMIKTIEAIPVLVDYNCKGNEEKLTKYLSDCGLTEPKLIVKKLKTKTLISVNGYRAWIAGVTGKSIIIHNAQQWLTDSTVDLYVKHLVKYLDKDRSGLLTVEEKGKEQIPLTSNRKGVTLYATKERNEEIYRNIVERLAKKSYLGVSSVKTFRAKLQSKEDLFHKLTTFEQLKVLAQIVRFMKCNAESSDLTLLKDGGRCGILLINKNITDVEFAIIHQSPCGLVERVQKV